MKPLNKDERVRAFNKVVGLFVLSFALAMILGFSTMNMNRMADSQSNRELKKLQSQLKFQREIFAPNINKATKSLSKIPVYKREGENIESLNADIGYLLSTMNNNVPNDDSLESRMYKNILKVYSALQMSYKDQMSLNDELDRSKNSTQGGNKELQDCLTKNRDLQTEINILKLTSNNNSSNNNNNNNNSSNNTSSGSNVGQLQVQLDDCNARLKKLNDLDDENRALKVEITKLRNR